MRQSGRAAANTAGVLAPRRCLRILWICAFTLSAHALEVAMAWQASAAHDTVRRPRLALRWVPAVATADAQRPALAGPRDAD
jgi:hypothetical protein